MRNLFISIVCYRDLDILNTIPDLFANAAEPEKIHLCVIVQDEPRNWYHYRRMQSPQVELHFFEPAWAEGCGKARAEAITHYDGERYFFQTDSHMRFDPGWDRQLKFELEACVAERPILTTLPPNFQLATGVKNPRTVNHLMFKEFYSSMPTHVGVSVDVRTYVPPAKPRRTGFLACGVMFAHGKLCEEFKYDPYFYFHGEEFSTNIRLWTMGYSNFTPRFCFSYHAYRSGQERPITLAYHEPVRDSFLHSRSMERIHVLLGVKSSRDALPTSIVDLHHYGLGNVRTVESWEQTFGVYIKKQEAEPRARWDHYEY